MLIYWYSIPYVFLAMFVEWMFCPTGNVRLEVIILIMPIALSAIAGVKGKTSEIIQGNIINCISSFSLVLAFSLCDNLILNNCSDVWHTYFKPFSALQIFVILEVLLLVLQIVGHRLSMRITKSICHANN